MTHVAMDKQENRLVAGSQTANKSNPIKSNGMKNSSVYDLQQLTARSAKKIQRETNRPQTERKKANLRFVD